ncbi:hypothetical protein B0H16DRAFT_1481272 [Mycena metata]|uniref:Uncharacterized protein n=1 Tax=Mycena metata TaxID=1033252 RepID=A0AAD7GZ07_9AGAR|nr:hypothetical protein B0H16DRAFT_1481272 [Mycena metata]
MSFVLTLPKPLRTLDVEPARVYTSHLRCEAEGSARQVYLKHPNADFWDKLNLKLQDIREKAGGESKKFVRDGPFVASLRRTKHGQKTYTGSDMEDKTDEFQQMVDHWHDGCGDVDSGPARWRVDVEEAIDRLN